MTEQPRTQAEFRRLVHECLDKAEALYDVDFGRVTITFDVKGEKAAQAIQQPHPNLGFVYKLRFNKDAIRLDWNGMVSSTIPHEVAHLVAFAKPSLRAENHNHRWRSIAIALGDTERGAVYHTMKLPPARRVRKFLYRNEKGESAAISARMHSRVQKEGIGFMYGRHRFGAAHYRGLAVRD
jgi:SprT protein